MQKKKKKKKCGEFPGGSVVRTLCFTVGDLGSVLGQGTKILQAKWCNPKKKLKFHVMIKGKIFSFLNYISAIILIKHQFSK